MTPGGAEHEWPGFTAEAHFFGTSVVLRFDDAVNRLRISLDGGEGGVFQLARPGRADFTLAHLPRKAHRITVEKLSESWEPATFGGFFLTPGTTALPPPPGPARRIAFIGDSDTVGYGGMVSHRLCNEGQVFGATDTTESYPALVARHFGAESIVTARSGIGLVRNYGGADPGRTMAGIYAQTIPGRIETAGLIAPPPEVIVVALGSNDFGSEFTPGEKWNSDEALQPDFETALTRFLQERRAEYPSALLVALAFGEYGAGLTGAYRNASNTLRREGARIVMVELPRLDRLGCHWHPSPRDHAMIADRLNSAIDAALQ